MTNSISEIIRWSFLFISKQSLWYLMADGKKEKQLQYDINHPNYGNLKECGMKNYCFAP